MWPHVLARQDSAVLVLQTHRPPRAKTRSGGNNKRGGEKRRGARGAARERESRERRGSGGRGRREGRQREQGSGGRAGVRVGGTGRRLAGAAGWRRGGGASGVLGMGGGGSDAGGRPNSPSPEKPSERASEAGQTKGGEAERSGPPRAGFLQVQRRGRAGSSEGEVTHARPKVSDFPKSRKGGRLGGFPQVPSDPVLCVSECRVWGREMGGQ